VEANIVLAIKNGDVHEVIANKPVKDVVDSIGAIPAREGKFGRFFWFTRDLMVDAGASSTAFITHAPWESRRVNGATPQAGK
jgi:hypothetical protein